MQVLRAYRYKLELKPEQEEILGREEKLLKWIKSTLEGNMA